MFFLQRYKKPHCFTGNSQRKHGFYVPEDGMRAYSRSIYVFCQFAQALGHLLRLPGRARRRTFAKCELFAIFEINYSI